MHVHICECYPAFCLSPSHFTPVFANSSNSSNHQPLFLSLFKKISSFSFPTSLHSPIIPRLLISSDINPILLSLSLCLFSHYSPSIPSVSLAPISPFCIFFEVWRVSSARKDKTEDILAELLVVYSWLALAYLWQQGGRAWRWSQQWRIPVPMGHRKRRRWHPWDSMPWRGPRLYDPPREQKHLEVRTVGGRWELSNIRMNSGILLSFI